MGIQSGTVSSVVLAIMILVGSSFRLFLDSLMFFSPSHEIVDSPVVSMAKIFQEAQFNRYLTNELARFVNGILVGRRKAFSSMSKGGPLSLLSCALDVLGDEPSQS